jgi:hypothetical protein
MSVIQSITLYQAPADPPEDDHHHPDQITKKIGRSRGAQEQKGLQPFFQQRKGKGNHNRQRRRLLPQSSPHPRGALQARLSLRMKKMLSCPKLSFAYGTI